MNKRFKKWENPIIKEGEMTKWHWKVQNINGFNIGEKVDIGSFTYINAKEGVILKDNVQIGSHCSIYSISTIDNKKGKIVMEENSSLGSHSVIMPGVRIGKNSIIGAFSFVNKNIPDNVICYGIPAKIIKRIDNK
jgi:acetyltransferase-like isoleucine patch superfamily enzyme